MFSPENPEAQKEYARELLRKAAEVALQISEGKVGEDAGNDMSSRYQQEYFDVTGNELTPDMIADEINAQADSLWLVVSRWLLVVGSCANYAKKTRH